MKRSLRVMAWIFAIYLVGWLGIWAGEKALGAERIGIPGITRKSSAIGFVLVSKRKALVSRQAKVEYNLILSHGFPWFLPKRSRSVCRYDGIAQQRGLEALRNDAASLMVTCLGRGEGILGCAGTRWVIGCDADSAISIRQE